MPAPHLETERLLLRQWKPEDASFFAKLNNDPKVMEYFPETLSIKKSNNLMHLIENDLQEKEYGLWAVEVKEKCPFIGFVGLHYVDFNAPFTLALKLAGESHPIIGEKGMLLKLQKKC